jgi:hypothetical protein
MKNQTDNSLFVEVKEDEAANVNGGFTWSTLFLYQQNQSTFYNLYGYDGYRYWLG